MSDFDDVSFLRIQSYSDHPEVRLMADLIVDSYVSGKRRSHRQKYIGPARSLVASLWLHPSSFFRFSTSEDHFGTKRKQVWMVHEVLTLFRHMLNMDPPMFNLVEAAIPPALALDGKGRSAVYCKSWFFTNTLKELTELDIVPDPDLPRISLKNEDDIWLPIPAEEKQAAWYARTDRIFRARSEMLYQANIRLYDGSPMPPGETTDPHKATVIIDLHPPPYACLEAFDITLFICA